MGAYFSVKRKKKHKANNYKMFKPVNDNKIQTKALVLVLLVYQNGVQLPAVPPSISCIYIVYFLFSAQFFSIYKVYFDFLLIAFCSLCCLFIDHALGKVFFT